MYLQQLDNTISPTHSTHGQLLSLSLSLSLKNNDTACCNGKIYMVFYIEARSFNRDAFYTSVTNNVAVASKTINGNAGLNCFQESTIFCMYYMHIFGLFFVRYYYFAIARYQFINTRSMRNAHCCVCVYIVFPN